MAHTLPLYRMTLGAQLDGTVLAREALHDSEIAQHIKEAMEESDATFLISGHPAMWPDAGFVDLVSCFWFFPSRPFDPIIRFWELGSTSGLWLLNLHRPIARACGREGSEPRHGRGVEEEEG